MSNIKYTSDGKKVSIVGKLNAQETIVQEIYISNGLELPSGENFVVKSLHDAPAISWKEKNLIDLEARYDKDRRDLEGRIDDLRKKYTSQSNLFIEKIKFIGAFLKEASEETFELIADYVSGKITHIVEHNYGAPKVFDFDQYNQQYESRLRLLTFFGANNGACTMGIGHYSDYGGGSTKIYPCKSLEAAINKMKDIILSGSLSAESITCAKKYGISIPKDKIDAYTEKQKDSLLVNISRHQKAIDTWNDEIIALDLI